MMSRRYGRNQKRKHLEEIVKWKQAQQLSAELMNYYSAELKDARVNMLEMRAIIESVCHNSIALPPKKLMGVGPRDRCRAEAFPPLDLGVVVGDDRPDSIAFRRIDLWALRVFLKENRETFQAAVHLEYSAGPHSAYMISERGLRAMPRETLLRKLVPQIGNDLVDHLRKGMA
jgi:hypothetical protein